MSSPAAAAAARLTVAAAFAIAVAATMAAAAVPAAPPLPRFSASVTPVIDTDELEVCLGSGVDVTCDYAAASASCALGATVKLDVDTHTERRDVPAALRHRYVRGVKFQGGRLRTSLFSFQSSPSPGAAPSYAQVHFDASARALAPVAFFGSATLASLGSSIRLGATASRARQPPLLRAALAAGAPDAEQALSTVYVLRLSTESLNGVPLNDVDRLMQSAQYVLVKLRFRSLSPAVVQWEPLVVSQDLAASGAFQPRELRLQRAARVTPATAARSHCLTTVEDMTCSALQRCQYAQVRLAPAAHATIDIQVGLIGGVQARYHRVRNGIPWDAVAYSRASRTLQPADEFGDTVMEYLRASSTSTLTITDARPGDVYVFSSIKRPPLAQPFGQLGDVAVDATTFRTQLRGPGRSEICDLLRLNQERVEAAFFEIAQLAPRVPVAAVDTWSSATASVHAQWIRAYLSPPQIREHDRNGDAGFDVSEFTVLYTNAYVQYARTQAALSFRLPDEPSAVLGKVRVVNTTMAEWQLLMLCDPSAPMSATSVPWTCWSDAVMAAAQAALDEHFGPPVYDANGGACPGNDVEQPPPVDDVPPPRDDEPRPPIALPTDGEAPDRDDPGVTDLTEDELAARAVGATSLAAPIAGGVVGALCGCVLLLLSCGVMVFVYCAASRGQRTRRTPPSTVAGPAVAPSAGVDNTYGSLSALGAASDTATAPTTGERQYVGAPVYETASLGAAYGPAGSSVGAVDGGAPSSAAYGDLQVAPSSSTTYSDLQVAPTYTDAPALLTATPAPSYESLQLRKQSWH